MLYTDIGDIMSLLRCYSCVLLFLVSLLLKIIYNIINQSYTNCAVKAKSK